MTDTVEFKAVLVHKHITAKELAEKVGMTASSLSLKINNLREFRAREIAAISEALNLTLEEREQIFFAKAVDK